MATKKSKKSRPAPLVLPPAGALPLAWPYAYAGAVISGLCYFLAFAGWDVWPLAFVALAPLFVSLHRQAPKRALLLGLVSGLAMNVCGFYWLQTMLVTFSGFPAAICFFFVLVVCGYQGGRMALLGWLYARASARGWPAAIVFGAAFVASELLYPLLFPWYFAACVHGIPVLTQVAELGGPILVGLVLVGANVALGELMIARLERRALLLPRIIVGLAGLVAGLGFGLWRVGAVDARVAESEEAKVGLVQANMGLMEKRQEKSEGLRRHLALTKEVRDKGVDFVVWSETSVMAPVPEDSSKLLLQANVGRYLGMPAIFGAVMYGPAPDYELSLLGMNLYRRPNPGDFVLYNTAVSSDAQGRINGRYDKEYLLAFGEYLPFGGMFPILYKWSPNSGRFSSGTSLDPLVVELHGKAHPVTMLICYEDILPGFTNGAVRHANPELLVNMTNDAWFGDSTEPWEHLALAQFRAIEHRRYLVRSTNSGVSAIIDPVGRVVAHTRTFDQEALSGSIRWMRASTVYEAIGDVPWWLVSALVVAGAFFKRRSAADRRSAEQPAATAQAES